MAMRRALDPAAALLVLLSGLLRQRLVLLVLRQAEARAEMKHRMYWLQSWLLESESVAAARRCLPLQQSEA